jgi:magnesium-transporting ATPase (P-type)
MEDREKELASCFDAVEVDLTLLGATGVEDQLQEEVQETLESLKIAGIKVTIFITIFLHDLITNIFSRYGC